MADAALVFGDDGRVAWVGANRRAPAADSWVDAGGRCVLPGFVDSHSHLVFAGDRAAEFDARMAGRRYEAGGIRTTVAATRAASDEDARRQPGPARRRDAPARHDDRGDQERLRIDGSGRGPRVGAGEVSRRTRRPTWARTSCPSEYADDTGGVRQARHRGDARCLRAARPLGRRLLRARAPSMLMPRARSSPQGWSRGLQARVHANQLGEGPGVQLACELGAASADHCTFLTDADVDALAASGTVVDAATRRRVLDPISVPRRPPTARRRGHGRARDRLQSRLVLHLVDAVLHRVGSSRDADDPGRGRVVSDRRWCGRATPSRRRAPGPRCASRLCRSRRTVVCAPGVPPWRPVGHRDPAGRSTLEHTPSSLNNSAFGAGLSAR